MLGYQRDKACMRGDAHGGEGSRRELVGMVHLGAMGDAVAVCRNA